MAATSSPNNQNYYEILEVPKTASLQDIRKAYLKKARETHPDKTDVSKTEAEEQFKRIKEAYEALKDEESRAIYDASLNAQLPKEPPKKDYAFNVEERKRNRDATVYQAVFQYSFKTVVTSQISKKNLSVQEVIRSWMSSLWSAPDDLIDSVPTTKFEEIQVPYMLVEIKYSMKVYYQGQTLLTKENVPCHLLLCPFKKMLKIHHAFRDVSDWPVAEAREQSPNKKLKDEVVDQNSFRKLLAGELIHKLRSIELAVTSALLLRHGGHLLNDLFIDFTIVNIDNQFISLPHLEGIYAYKNQSYIFSINGCTHTVEGERPYSTLKIAGWTIVGGTLALLASFSQ